MVHTYCVLQLKNHLNEFSKYSTNVWSLSERQTPHSLMSPKRKQWRKTPLVCIMQLKSVGCIHVYVWQSIVIRVHYSPMVANPVITALWLKCCWFSLQHGKTWSSCHWDPLRASCCVTDALWWFNYPITVAWRGKSGKLVWTYYRHDVIRSDGGQSICETEVHYLEQLER